MTTLVISALLRCMPLVALLFGTACIWARTLRGQHAQRGLPVYDSSDTTAGGPSRARTATQAHAFHTDCSVAGHLRALMAGGVTGDPDPQQHQSTARLPHVPVSLLVTHSLKRRHKLQHVCCLATQGAAASAATFLGVRHHQGR